MRFEIEEAFREAGHEIYLVGGSVRDVLLRRDRGDTDYCTDALPEQTFEILSRFGRPHRVGEKFGTIGLGDVEVTTYRTEVYDGKSRKPVVAFGTNLHEDLARRDFTMNAIAFDAAQYNPNDSALQESAFVDPFNGRRDIDARIIRCVGLPHERFAEDPLRMLRAIRFAATLGFIIETRTELAIRARDRTIVTISWERVRDEFSKIVVGDPDVGMDYLRRTGLLSFIAPELVMLNDERTQGFYHNKNIWGHTLMVMRQTSPNLILRLAALLHDVGKMATRSERDGQVHFYGHEEVSTILAESMLRRMRYPNDVIERVCRLVKHHMQVNHYHEVWTDGTVRRLMERMGDDIDLAIELARCDQEAHKRGTHDPVNDLQSRVDRIRAEVPLVLPVNGTDLMERYQRAPGPWIREIKDRLMELMLDGSLVDREFALSVADGIVSREGVTGELP